MEPDLDSGRAVAVVDEDDVDGAIILLDDASCTSIVSSVSGVVNVQYYELEIDQ